MTEVLFLRRPALTPMYVWSSIGLAEFSVTPLRFVPAQLAYHF
jgi:hypothetical protein